MNEQTPGPEWHWDGTQWLWWNGSSWQQAGVQASDTTPPVPESAADSGLPPTPVATQPPTPEPPATASEPTAAAPTPPPVPAPAPPEPGPPSVPAAAAPEAGPPPAPVATPPPLPQPGVIAAAAAPPTAPRRRLGGAAIAAIIVGVVLVLVIAGGGGFFVVSKVLNDEGGGNSETVTLQTEPLSTAVAAFTPPAGTDTPVTPPPATGVQEAPADTAGLYGGTLDNSSCDKTQLVNFLQANPDMAAGWAQTLDITADQIPTYVASRTPVLLRSDTAVTNHGYENGKVTSFPSLLQAGTAVLVNEFGQPVVKCYCGNPLTAAPAKLTNVKYTGPTWPDFKPDVFTVVQPSTVAITNFVMVDVVNNTTFVRPASTDGSQDSPGDSIPATSAPTATTAPAPTAEAGREAQATALAEQRFLTCLNTGGFEGDSSAIYSAVPTGTGIGVYKVSITPNDGSGTINVEVNVDASTVTPLDFAPDGCPGVFN